MSWSLIHREDSPGTGSAFISMGTGLANVAVGDFLLVYVVGLSNVDTVTYSIPGFTQVGSVQRGRLYSPAFYYGTIDYWWMYVATVPGSINITRAGVRVGGAAQFQAGWCNYRPSVPTVPTVYSEFTDYLASTTTYAPADVAVSGSANIGMEFVLNQFSGGFGPATLTNAGGFTGATVSAVASTMYPWRGGKIPTLGLTALPDFSRPGPTWWMSKAVTFGDPPLADHHWLLCADGNDTGTGVHASITVPTGSGPYPTDCHC